MCNDIFNYLMNIKPEELQDEIKNIDGTHILELYEYVQTETSEKLNEYKNDKKSILQELTSIVSQYTIKEIHLLKCNFILVLLSEELCERLVNNINEQISIYSNLKKEIVSDVLNPFYKCIKTFDNLKLSTVDNNILELIEKACLRFSNVDNEIELCENDIFNSYNIKLLLEYDFADDFKDTNTNVVKFNAEIQNGINDSLKITKDVLSAGITGGEQGAITAVCANSEKIADTVIKLVENTYKKMNEQDKSDKQSNIKYINDMLEYAKLISKAFSIDASIIFTNFNNNIEKLNNLKNQVAQELKILDPLISEFDFGNEKHTKILAQVVDTIKEILNIFNSDITQTI